MINYDLKQKLDEDCMSKVSTSFFLMIKRFLLYKQELVYSLVNESYKTDDITFIWSGELVLDIDKFTTLIKIKYRVDDDKLFISHLDYCIPIQTIIYQ